MNHPGAGSLSAATSVVRPALEPAEPHGAGLQNRECWYYLPALCRCCFAMMTDLAGKPTLFPYSGPLCLTCWSEGRGCLPRAQPPSGGRVRSCAWQAALTVSMCRYTPPKRPAPMRPALSSTERVYLKVSFPRRALSLSLCPLALPHSPTGQFPLTCPAQFAWSFRTPTVGL